MRHHRTKALLCLLLLMVCGCRDGRSQDSRAVVDMLGRHVLIPHDVSRVVGTGGAVDEWILLLGHPEKLVATSVAFQKNPWVRKVYPAIAKLPTPFSNSDANMEALLASRPQLAILLSGMTAQERMEKAGIPAVVLERRDFKELKEGILLAGSVLGAEENLAAMRLCAYFDSNLAYARSRTGNLPDSNRPRVLYVGGTGLSTEGKGTLVQSWIEIAGGSNVAADSGYAGMGKTIPMEQILRWNPQILICMSGKTRDQILANPQWARIEAVARGKVFVNPKGVYSWGVRSAEEALQVLWAAKIIHPELFAELDMVDRIRDFHRRFYKCEISQTEARLMLEAKNPDGSHND
jgi:iron complex transport system substrate-binding protein